MSNALSEVFIAPQGEGLYSGELMAFIRFAGCPVGRYDHGNIPDTVIAPNGAPLKDWFTIHRTHSYCQTVHGANPFPCDTDYHSKLRMTNSDIAKFIREAEVCHACFTGGEPFAAPRFQELMHYLFLAQPETMFHFETSGTVPIGFLPASFPISSQALEELDARLWVTCAPKKGYLAVNDERVDEWKFLITDKSEWKAVAHFLKMHPHAATRPIYLQPLGDLKTTPAASYEPCLEVQQHLKDLGIHARVGSQLHKLLGTR